ncbi:hypothetical protein PENDEC_c003G03196 [Penicillium decumbens]|uniref:Methyltransferase domain-containing protein n=1 Tax=Penicillium decumbens TaxID=69771 RepID=A0A1V6PJ22_PENDC|nr:hypothetical protein PENDEC_c003G03196 [Penicillium decumbens]
MIGFLKRVLGARNDVYGLDHAVLNMRLPPSMWMNMGYWESTTDFPQACQALLEQVLAAGVLTDKSQSIRVLDVGCGCGDQSLYLTGLQRGVSSSAGPEFETTALRHRSAGSPLIDTYVGITLEPAQAALAKSRVCDENSVQISADVFCADASDPTSWSGDLLNSMTEMTASSEDNDTSTWLLALDTMYHFRPSRLPLLRYAQRTLHASLMAFDLILADRVSWRERLILRIVCWLTGSPFSNFITREEYLRVLVAAGYDPSRIEMRDVSRHVFPGLSGFLGRRIKEAQPLGLRMGKFRAARMVFDWWARSGVVRGVVVVAKR